jgi:hypothetical protein
VTPTETGLSVAGAAVDGIASAAAKNRLAIARFAMALRVD